MVENGHPVVPWVIEEMNRTHHEFYFVNATVEGTSYGAKSLWDFYAQESEELKSWLESHEFRNYYFKSVYDFDGDAQEVYIWGTEALGAIVCVRLVENVKIKKDIYREIADSLRNNKNKEERRKLWIIGYSKYRNNQ